MVLNYYNLKDQPFGVTPDPRYLYLSASHREALASLSYGIRSRRGFMSLIAEPGMGKTTILFELLRYLEGSARTVFLCQTLCSPKELLCDVLRDLGVVVEAGNAGSTQEQLNRVLLAEARQGRNVVVIIDEAQNLEHSALELLRMLSNFETRNHKLIQIILAGQPQLREKLASPDLLQLRQRMSIFARLHRFNNEEPQLYVKHRLRIAGYDFKAPLFTPEAETLIAKYSEGVPRIINNICFNAISLGSVLKQKTIRGEVVRECLHDLDIHTEDVDEERARPEMVAFSGPKVTKVSGSASAWRRAFTFFVVLFLLSSPSRQRPEWATTHSVVAVSASSRMSAIQPISFAESSDHQQPAIPAVDNKPEPSKEPSTRTALISWTGNPSPSTGVASSTSTQKSRPHPRLDLEHTSDPAELWAEVQNQNSDAEIALARLYLEGRAVPQNCAQAQVLLLAASRKGNARAADLLSDLDGQCY